MPSRVKKRRSSLRRIRIFTAGLTFFLFCLAFLYRETAAGFISDWLRFSQLVPSLINFVLSPWSLAGLGLVFIILLSLLFGRVYCSFLCPLGAFQDISIALSRFMGLRPYHSAAPDYHLVRYTVLVLIVVMAAGGSMAGLNLLDPYSLWGRFCAHLLVPFKIAANNLLTDLLESLDMYVLFPLPPHQVGVGVVFVSLATVAIVTVMAMKGGRVYCNSLCPVGTALGSLACFSIYQFNIDTEVCGVCRQCLKVCKSGCIDIECLTVDHSRCVNCFSCLEACSLQALKYEPRVSLSQRRNR